MNHRAVAEWRDDIKSTKTEVQTDVRWIKENLRRVYELHDYLATQVARVKAFGSFAVVLGAGLVSLVINLITR